MTGRREFSRKLRAAIILRQCSVNECTLEARARGLCNRHYLRWKRHGDPLGGRRTLAGEPLSFFEWALTSETDECIVWPFSKATAGYGTMWLDGDTVNVPREVLRRTKGEPPRALMVSAHSPGVCHNPSCINRRHLRWATEEENAADRKIDGTHRVGEATNSAKLTVDQVRKIRRDERSSREVAQAFDVSVKNVWSIRAGRTWGWLHD